MVDRFEGMIVQYDERKSWGFIQGSSHSHIFFHRSNCSPGFQPELGVNVTYVIGKPFNLGKPEQAIDVRGNVVVTTESGAAGGL